MMAEHAEKSVFQRIIDREIPAKIVYEDDLCLAFEDIHPQAPTHLIVIPKKAIASVDDVSEADREIVGHLFLAMRRIAEKLGLKDGYRVVTNCGRDAGQEVMHLHFHMLAGRRFTWPPG
jgi:histidine triad (HIT) family protein